MKHMKLMLGIALLVAAALAMSSCAKNEAEEPLTSTVIGDALVQGLSMSQMVTVQESNITARFDIAENLLETSCVYVSTDVNDADEIAVFEVKDKKDLDLVYAALGIHNNQKAQTFKALDNAEYQKVLSTILVRRESYVIMVTAEQTGKANAIIDHYLPNESAKRKN